MRSGAKVGIVRVSHSVALAEGAAELAAQIGGGEVTIVAAGGTDDGRVGEDDPRLDPRWTPTRPPLAGPAASARAAGPVGWSPAGQRCATEMRGGEALGHDHAPCVGDELAHLGDAERGHARVYPVEALVAGAGQKEPGRLGRDQRVPFFPGETEANYRLVRRRSDLNRFP